MSARREASKRLGLELSKRYEKLCLASGEDEVSRAAVELGALFNENIEQICWFLKEYGGMQQLPLERRPKPDLPAAPLPKTPDILRG